jgi:putative flippase GtrA
VYNNTKGYIIERVLTLKKLLNIAAYLFFGGLTTIINIVTYKIMLDLGIDYRLSAFLAFIVAVLFAFITNRKYVFKGTGHVWQECLAFFGMRGLTFGVNLLGLIVLVQYFGLDELWSQIIVNVVVIVLNFVLSKFVVFNLENIKETIQKAVS